MGSVFRVIGGVWRVLMGSVLSVNGECVEY